MPYKLPEALHYKLSNYLVEYCTAALPSKVVQLGGGYPCPSLHLSNSAVLKLKLWAESRSVHLALQNACGDLGCFDPVFLTC